MTRPDGSEVTRYLSDKAIPDLVDEFGLHVNRDREISLNIYNSDNPVLFFKTPHVVNGDILESAFTDTEATNKIKVLTEQYQNAQSIRRNSQDNLRVDMAAKNSLVMYDIEKETDTLQKLSKCQTVLSSIYMPEIQDIPDVPEILSVQLPSMRLHNCEMPLVVSLPPMKLENLDTLWEELLSLEEGVCPECGRPFSSHQTCINDTQTSTV